jgi:VanZ family protein
MRPKVMGFSQRIIIFTEHRSIRWLLILYSLFILYGSFIPFHFTTNVEFIGSETSRFFILPYQNGIKNFSTLDVVSNVLLFVPFGFLLLGSRLSVRSSLAPLLGVLLAWTYGFLFGLSIEIGQLFSPGRTASILDALCNAIGAFGGGVLGYVVFKSARAKVGQRLLELILEQPSWVLLALAMVVPVAASFYPFHLTLDVSTAWGNLKRTEWIPFVGGFHRFWVDLVVEKLIVFAIIGHLAYSSILHVVRSRSKIWLLTILFALSLEGGKLLFVGRVPNVEDFVLNSAGGWLGVFIVSRLATTRIIEERPTVILVAALVALIAYSELTPFDWVASSQDIHATMLKIEWLPMGAYYRADLQSALFDLGKKCFLICPLGFLIAGFDSRVPSAKRRRVALLIGVVLGWLLESSQLFLKSRVPSITDVTMFGLLSWTGAVMFDKYQSVIGAARALSLPHSGSPAAPDSV